MPLSKQWLFSSLMTFYFLIFFTTIHAQVTDSSSMNGPEVRTFYSSVLGEKRKIIIQTPARMNQFDAHPVLYVLDGEAQMQMIGGQVEYLSEAYKIIPNLIVVGIENTDRTRDLTPTHSIIGADGKPDTSVNSIGKNSGGGEKFLQFIHQELMPWVDSAYHTAPFKILSGHSLGALMAVYCLLHHPDYFNAYIAISPSLQWDSNFMLHDFSSHPFTSTNRFLFFSDANEDASFHQNQLELDSILHKKKYHGLIYKRNFYPDETHISEPVKAFYDGIRFIYPDWHLPYNSSAFRKTMNSKIIRDHFNELSKKYGYNVIPLHDDINQISRFLRNDPARIQDAIELLEMNAINYPTSSTVQEILGDTWLKAGDKTKASTAYKKALQLNPSSSSVADKLKNVSGK
ncbi:MAG: alpha/beta hydrolase-fold protein [Flavisolibacter sp.]|jgi:predicted alpha/beta superfamily hydrolase